MDELSRLTANLSEILVYAAIALVTLIGLIKCIYPLLRNAALLNRAVIKLEKSTAAGERPLWREARFLGRSLRNEWQQFLLNAGQLDMRGIPCDTREYINEESVVEKPGHAQLAELIPGLLTSLGILGTFMGLMQGLTSVDFSNAQGTIESIPQLLGGMRFAFATSVAGIACSLMFNMFNRMAAGRAIRALDNFEDAFYELAMPRPLQPEVQLMCQKQDEDARMAHLAESMSNHIAASLEMAIGRAMSPLTQSLDTFIKCATREQVDGVRRIVGQFVQQMNTSLSDQMTALGDTMRAVNQGQIQTQQNLQTTLDAARAMAQDAKAMQLASAEIARQMQLLNEEMENERLGRANDVSAAQSAGDNLTKRLEALSDSLGRMQAAVDQLTGELNDQPQDANEPEQATLDM
ncbi:MAG: MotA/TolQ/ExbB proton channel family protein [Clostridiales bacterium]|nr:MotA/TolQ/ExbB proton channel family protein [Clostridiales bacterium]MDO4350485.1 MotA/TolQ/ExbB proton channel family protein [Eubacteriales bacterium]MDY4009303.1 MotA/TolQ/ExbB proton channel family protein [Candidatus Limiplasma sp.]